MVLVEGLRHQGGLSRLPVARYPKRQPSTFCRARLVFGSNSRISWLAPTNGVERQTRRGPGAAALRVSFGGWHVRVTFFGGPRLLSDKEEAIRGRSAHRRRLGVLALLCTAPTRGVTRERIIAYLWPEDDAEKGRRQLSEAIYLIRKELGDDTISVTGEVLAAGAGLNSDVGDFRRAIAEGRLRDAVETYSGPFLDAWYVEGASEFERWSSETREDLAREFRESLTELATRAESSDQWTEAAEWWARLSREEPHSPRVAMRHAVALDRAGERAAAIQALDLHQHRLHTDLELTPAPELLELQAALRATAGRAASPEGIVRGVQPVGEPSAPPQAPRPDSTTRRRVVTPMRALAVAAALVAVAWGSQRDVGVPPVARVPLDPRNIAVMYFDDHSEGRRLGHIADGLTEELIHQLAQVPALHVVSRNGVKRFRDDPISMDSLASAFRVGLIVEGSIQQSRDSLRVTVQLIDGNTGLHVDSRSFARRRDDLFAMQEDLAASVASSLRRRLGETFALQAIRRDTRSAEALEWMLRARTLRHDAERIALHPHENDARSALQLLAHADSLLQNAAVADPEWVRPRVERGWIWLQRAGLRPDSLAIDDLRRALALAEQAVGAGTGSQAETLELRGISRWRLLTRLLQDAPDSPEVRLAENDLRAALAADSTRPLAWATLADVMAVKGALAESEVAAERAVEQDAWLEGAERAYFRGFAAAHLLGRFRDAILWCRRGQVALPQSWRFYECELTAMREDTASPNPRQAWSLVARLDSLDPPATAATTGHAFSPIYRRAVAAAISARAGDRQRALRELEALRARVAGDSTMILDLLYSEAYIVDLLGDRSRARVLMDSLFRARPMLRVQYDRDPLIRRLQ